MANKDSNFPSNNLNKLPEEFCAETVTSLKDLAKRGKPKSLEELALRIDSFFSFCAENGFRPGIESLCLSLDVSRMTLWNWCNGINCSKEWQEECLRAKQFVLVFLEQCTMQGKINPASSIFYFKNWASYKDAISFDESITQTSVTSALSADALPRLNGGNINADEN